MAAKEDQRAKLTRLLLQNALLELLQQKPIQALTVKELCEKAGVNRGTFYLHYLDIYDLLEKMEDELLAELQAILAGASVLGGAPGHSSSGFIPVLFRFFEKNREMCAILLGEHGDKKFVQRIIGMGREKTLLEYAEVFPGASQQETGLFYTFVASGFLALLQHGFQENIPLEELASQAEKLVAASVHFFSEP